MPASNQEFKLRDDWLEVFHNNRDRVMATPGAITFLFDEIDRKYGMLPPQNQPPKNVSGSIGRGESTETFPETTSSNSTRLPPPASSGKTASVTSAGRLFSVFPFAIVGHYTPKRSARQEKF